MTLSGDEPQLGGQSDDLSPMISSVVTKVIADARGAYVVGNLDALIGLMNAEQGWQFRQYLAQMMLFHRAGAYDSEAQDLISTLLAAESADEAEEVRARGEELVRQMVIAEYGSSARNFDIAYAVVTLTLWTVPKLVWDAVVRRTDMRDEAVNEAISSLIKRQMVEAGWSILQQKAPPVIVHIERDEVITARNDAEWMRRDGNRAVLLRLMTDEQRLRFRQALARQSLRYAENVLRPVDQEHGERNLLDHIRLWIAEPNEVNREALASLIGSMRDHRFDRDPYVHHDYAYMTAYRAGLVAMETGAFRAAQQMPDVIYCAGKLVGRDHSETWRTVWPLVSRWQVETAWTILQGHDLPSYHFIEP